MLYNDGKAGFLTTIIGPMFSEKSGELIKYCLHAQKYQNKIVQVFKPVIDDRYGKDEVASRLGMRMAANNIHQDLPADVIAHLYALCADADIVAFDEAQFFAPAIVEVVQRLLDQKKHVLVAGLNLDYLGRPFGSLDKLLLFSDEVITKTAFCRCCGRPAMYTQRVLGGREVTASSIGASQVLIGDTESYEARCRLCYVKD